MCRGVFSFIPGAWRGDLEVVLAIRPDLELELDGVSGNRVIEDSPSGCLNKAKWRWWRFWDHLSVDGSWEIWVNQSTGA